MFKFPIPRLKTTTNNRNRNLPKDLPVTKRQDIEIKETIGEGTYGKVLLCVKNKVELILKELKDDDEGGQRLFYKEARLLNSINHENIVAFNSVLDDPLKTAYLMEYVSFDLKPFSQSGQVSSLKELLSMLDSQGDFEGFQHFQVFS